MKPEKYPQLRIDMNHLRHNIREIVKLCKEDGIGVTGVIKVFNGIGEVAKAFYEEGCASIGSSRIEQLQEMKKINSRNKTMLIRIPMLSELKKVVDYADISLNSEYEIIERINKICGLANKKHGVILMFDLGDLREGYFEENEIIQVAINIENKLSNIELKGIGTNIGCYGSIMPTIKNMNHLVNIAEKIEESIGRKLEIISGGASTSLSLVKDHVMPDRINHLRIGEAITLNKDMTDYWGCDFSNMYRDVFMLNAEIIEIKEKSSYPIGEIFIDAFGNKPEYTDIGIRKRALLAVGRQDFANHNQLIPVDEGIKIIGSSSDHLIIDITDSHNQYKLGDKISFNMYYESLLYLSGSKYVNKIII